MKPRFTKNDLSKKDLFELSAEEKSAMDSEELFRRNMLREFKKHVGYFAKDDYEKTSDGYVWKSSGNHVPEDIVGHWYDAELISLADLVNHREGRDKAFAKFAENYKAAMANRSPEAIAEERAEARAAHGPGVTLVNVITGERYVT